MVFTADNYRNYVILALYTSKPFDLALPGLIGPTDQKDGINLNPRDLILFEVKNCHLTTLIIF